MLRLVLNTLLCLKILLILKVGHSRVKSCSGVASYSIALVLDGQLNIVMIHDVIPYLPLDTHSDVY